MRPHLVRHQDVQLQGHHTMYINIDHWYCHIATQFRPDTDIFHQLTGMIPKNCQVLHFSRFIQTFKHLQLFSSPVTNVFGSMLLYSPLTDVILAHEKHLSDAVESARFTEPVWRYPLRHLQKLTNMASVYKDLQKYFGLRLRTS